MKTEIIKAFVISWTNEKVTCYCYEVNEHRVFEINPLFQNYKLFKGKNVWFETTIKIGEMTISCKESKRSWLIQKWNFLFEKLITIFGINKH